MATAARVDKQEAQESLLRHTVQKIESIHTQQQNQDFAPRVSSMRWQRVTMLSSVRFLELCKVGTFWIERKDDTR